MACIVDPNRRGDETTAVFCSCFCWHDTRNCLIVEYVPLSSPFVLVVTSTVGVFHTMCHDIGPCFENILELCGNPGRRTATETRVAYSTREFDSNHRCEFADSKGTYCESENNAVLA